MAILEGAPPAGEGASQWMIDADTWLWSAYFDGMWRTANGGATWDSVIDPGTYSTANGVRVPGGKFYSGGVFTTLQSDDGGPGRAPDSPGTEFLATDGARLFAARGAYYGVAEGSRRRPGPRFRPRPSASRTTSSPGACITTPTITSCTPSTPRTASGASFSTEITRRPPATTTGRSDCPAIHSKTHAVSASVSGSAARDLRPTGRVGRELRVEQARLRIVGVGERHGAPLGGDPDDARRDARGDEVELKGRFRPRSHAGAGRCSRSRINQ